MHREGSSDKDGPKLFLPVPNCRSPSDCSVSECFFLPAYRAHFLCCRAVQDLALQDLVLGLASKMIKGLVER